MADSRIVTLLTDFGLSDYFVAAMKGVMLSLNPNLAFVDITHLIPPQDIHSAAFALGQASRMSRWRLPFIGASTGSTVPFHPAGS